MKCSKCDKETNDHSKFCSHCGIKVEEVPMHVRMDNLVKESAKTWFILGVIRGSFKDKKNKSLQEFEKTIQKNHREMWEWYHEVIEYWKEWAEQKDEENKKTNRSKRISLPKTERSQTK